VWRVCCSNLPVSDRAGHLSFIALAQYRGGDIKADRQMDEIVNLNKYRKTRMRQESRVQADANRTRYGIAKADRVTAAKESARLTADLDGKRLE